MRRPVAKARTLNILSPGMLGIIFILFAILLACTNLFGAGSSPHYISIDGEISPGMAAFVGRSVEEAKAVGAPAIVVGIDTFGGRVDSAIAITHHIEAAGEIPVYAYVEDKAWSAGALISLACGEIFMQHGATIGSATPVAGSGGGNQPQVLGEKHVSAIRAKFRALAEKNGYNSDLAAAMVDEDIEIKEVVRGGKKRLITGSEIENLKAANKLRQIKIQSTVSEKGKLVNLTAERAKELGLASNVLASKDEVLTQFGFSGPFVEVRRGPFEKAVGFLTSAAVSSMLLTLGFILLYLEFQAPGMSWAGISGVLCLALVFGGQYLIDYAEWIDVALFAVGIGLIALEVFVIPGFGFAGIGGITCLAIALYLAFVPFDVPRVPWEVDLTKRALLIILGSFVASFVGGMFLLGNLQYIPGLNKLVLTTTLAGRRAKRGKPPRDDSPLVGDEGEALSTLRPVGKGSFSGKIHDVVAEQGMVDRGAKVEVVGIRGNELIVRESVAVATVKNGNKRKQKKRGGLK
jgi:membrane-bound serine protease (ClpP class)